MKDDRYQSSNLAQTSSRQRQLLRNNGSLETLRRPQMAETINAGTILIKDGTFLPDALRFETEPCASGWRLVKNLDGYGLDRKIHGAGWTSF
jgi:hypothetical protein